MLWLLNWLINLQVLKGLDFFLIFGEACVHIRGVSVSLFVIHSLKLVWHTYVLSLTFLTKYSCWSKFVRKNFFTKNADIICGHTLEKNIEVLIFRLDCSYYLNCIYKPSLFLLQTCRAPLKILKKIFLQILQFVVWFSLRNSHN